MKIGILRLAFLRILVSRFLRLLNSNISEFHNSRCTCAGCGGSKFCKIVGLLQK